MGFKISNFRMDTKKENDGVWVQAGAGLELLVARITATKYEEFIKAKAKPFGRMLRSHADLMSGELDDVVKEGVSKFILLGWKNLQDDNGNDIVYSQAKALELLSAYPDLYRMVVDFASDAALFRAESKESALGNSETSSTGNSSTGK